MTETAYLPGFTSLKTQVAFPAFCFTNKVALAFSDFEGNPSFFENKEQPIWPLSFWMFEMLTVRVPWGFGVSALVAPGAVRPNAVIAITQQRSGLPFGVVAKGRKTLYLRPEDIVLRRPRLAQEHLGVLFESVSPREPEMRNPDVVVIGAGFGGLAAALRLAELGLDVVLCETLRYPGGCASTFTRSGYQFEAGATLFSGLGEGQLFSKWNDKWDLGVRFNPLDPLVELRTRRWSLAVPPDRDSFVERFVALPGADPEALRGFFRTQRRVADALWTLFEDPSLLPPLNGSSVVRHLGRSLSYAPVVRWMGRSLAAVVAQHGLAEWEPLRVYLDAVSQITVQASCAEAEAPFAMAALDYFFRGTGHVHGGIGSLAWAMTDAIRKAGGKVLLANRVRGIRREAGRWHVNTRKGELRAQTVVANVLPQSLSDMTQPQMNGALRDVEASVESGWGAAMLYLAVDSNAVRGLEAQHLQLVDDETAPFLEGNHVFCSISAADEHERAPEGQRTVTVSTHIPMKKLRNLEGKDQGAYVAATQSRMRRTIGRRAPELLEHMTFEMSASPRTFARFTGRHLGYVGGVPRRAGWKHYRPRALWPREAMRDLFLVGDSVLLGQSTLAVALGGVRTAERIASRDTSSAKAPGP